MHPKIYNAHIICPITRVNDYLLYCSHAMRLTKVNFKINHIDESFSKLVIVDQENLNHISEVKNSSAFTYLLFFWNGQLDYIKYSKKIKILKKKFKKKIIIYLAGNANNINNMKKVTFDKFYNNNVRIIGASKIKLFLYQNPFFKSLIILILNPLLSLKYLFKKKIIFIGSIEVAFLENRKKFYHKDFFNLLKDYLRVNENNRINYLKNLIYIKQFKKLEIFYKFYIVQIIYRQIFIGIMKKFENFEFLDNDKNIKFYSSVFFKNNYYIDLGTKVGSDIINPRSILLKKYHNKNTIYLKFFEKGIFSNKNFKIEMSKITKFLKNLKEIENRKYSFLETKEILIENYRKSKFLNNK